MNTVGILLVNLGTPDAPTPEKVGAYLREFLMDPDVIDIPYPFRWALVNFLILRGRARASAEAYRKIWTSRGSPLLFHTLELAAAVQREADAAAPGRHRVKMAMRYGNPSIESALAAFRDEGLRKILALPLYPQYSLSATESSVREIRRVLSKLEFSSLDVDVLPPFCDSPFFLDAVAAVSRAAHAAARADFTLFSFHGLPERQVRKAVRTSGFDYREQCFAAARGLAARLEIPAGEYGVSFQSRLGRTPWIRPFTDVVLTELASGKLPDGSRAPRPVRRLAVLCPSFVSDCLETLEEIAIRGRDIFRASGGEELVYIPAVNAREEWAKAVLNIAVTRAS
ncbi:MAG: ferrochelatase [Deltaproteobacteria bacterium]|nr:ferrochelatase [Deltaproteobacteria bacterium]